MNAKELQEAVSNLGCNAFIGVAHPVEFESVLAWHVQDDTEEKMIPVDEVIAEIRGRVSAEALAIFTSYEKLGVTDIVLIRGW